MIDVKLLVSDKAKEQIPQRNDSYNLKRYQAFVETFGQGNFGLVSASSLERELSRGIPCQTIVLNDNLDIIDTEYTSVDCTLFIASNFERLNGDKMKLEEMTGLVDYIEGKVKEGSIGYMVNTGKATLAEDKLFGLEIGKTGFRTPPTYHFQSFKDFEEFVLSSEDAYILKHRFGEAGKQVSKVTRKNIGDFRDFNIEEYISQSELDIESEVRIICFDGEFLGSRIIFDRTRPWEVKGASGRKHTVEKYKPFEWEVDETKKVLELVGATLGCIDWVNTSDGLRYFLEFNGAGTGMGYKGHPYDLTQTLAHKLKEKYL